MVVYMENGSIIAAGNLLTDHHSIHGHSIPPHHVCVLLTAAKEKYKAPLVLGDEDENFFLEKGKFFAFPRKSLFMARLSNNVVSLEPLEI